MSFQKIIIEADVKSSNEKVWHYYTDPEHVKMWNFASEDWYCPNAENDLRVGGHFKYRMSSTDDQMGFDFEGDYTEVVMLSKISYKLGEEREVHVTFDGDDVSTKVIVVFDAESENSLELQKTGWQAILDNFKTYVEA